MRISECMSRDIQITYPERTIREAAGQMGEWDTGALPVGDNDRLVGMITDRDIAIRAVAQGKGPDTKVWEVMTADVEFCSEDDEVEEVLELMGRLQVRRLPVLNRDHNLIGIVTLSDLAKESEKTGEALGEIARAGGERSQPAH